MSLIHHCPHTDFLSLAELQISTVGCETNEERREEEEVVETNINMIHIRVMLLQL